MLGDKLHKQIVRQFGVQNGNAHQEVVSHLLGDSFFQIGNILLNLLFRHNHFPEFHAGGIVSALYAGAAAILRSLFQYTHDYLVQRTRPGGSKGSGKFSPYAGFQNLLGVPGQIAGIVSRTIRNDKRRHLHGPLLRRRVLVVARVQHHIEPELIFRVLRHCLRDILRETIIVGTAVGNLTVSLDFSHNGILRCFRSDNSISLFRSPHIQVIGISKVRILNQIFSQRDLFNFSVHCKFNADNLNCMRNVIGIVLFLALIGLYVILIRAHNADRSNLSGKVRYKGIFRLSGIVVIWLQFICLIITAIHFKGQCSVLVCRPDCDILAMSHIQHLGQIQAILVPLLVIGKY